METQLKQLISEEMKQFHCSVLLNKIKDIVRKLKAYGVSDEDIVAVMKEEDEFPQLMVTEDYKIVLCGEESLEVKMEPLLKAVYLLFLSHPKGIVLKYLPDYREELMALYLLLRPSGMTERVQKSIMDVTNPTLNSINEKCTRIRKIFSELLPVSIAGYYAITGKRGEPKKIDIVRSNVIWKCKIPNSQGL
jgi:hypothetical protein